MKDTGIYLITNTVSGRRYVGSAASFKKRWREHERQLHEGRHHSRYLQRAWNKHGAGVFTFRPIIYCAKPDLIMYEQAAMDALKPEYNIAPTAGSQLGYKHTDATRAKLREAKAKNPSSHRKGAVHTDEAKRKISESRKGKGGGPRSPERLAKISAALKGRPVSEEMKKRISATLLGHKQSAETIAKRTEKLRGRKMPPGFAEATSKRMMGRKLPESHVHSIRISKSKLSEDQIREIRYMLSSGQRHTAIAEKFSINRHTVADISCGRKYWWVTP